MPIISLSDDDSCLVTSPKKKHHLPRSRFSINRTCPPFCISCKGGHLWVLPPGVGRRPQSASSFLKQGERSLNRPTASSGTAYAAIFIHVDTCGQGVYYPPDSSPPHPSHRPPSRSHPFQASDRYLRPALHLSGAGRDGRDPSRGCVQIPIDQLDDPKVAHFGPFLVGPEGGGRGNHYSAFQHFHSASQVRRNHTAREGLKQNKKTRTQSTTQRGQDT